jgi:hypothetical protein
MAEEVVNSVTGGVAHHYEARVMRCDYEVLQVDPVRWLSGLPRLVLSSSAFSGRSTDKTEGHGEGTFARAAVLVGSPAFHEIDRSALQHWRTTNHSNVRWCSVVVELGEQDDGAVDVSCAGYRWIDELRLFRD